MSSQRYFKNNFPDYDGQPLLADDKTLRPKYKQYIESNIIRLFEYWEKNHQNNPSNDTSMYTGSIGWAVLYLKVYESKILPDSEKYLHKALEIVDKALEHYDKIKLPTYLCGEVGLLTTAIVVYHYLNKDYKKFIQDLISFQPQIYKIDSDELLYGRIGYLYSFLYLRWKIPETASMIHDEFIRGIVAIILNSGAQTSAQQKSIYPLTYYWYRDPYVGAAHGYLGIIYFLLHSIKFITEDELNRLIRPTIDLILNLQFKSGNFPPCIGEREDLLVHWCHGAPGAIYLFVKAYEIFKEPRYLEAAKAAAETIWKRGLLIKGNN